MNAKNEITKDGTKIGNRIKNRFCHADIIRDGDSFAAILNRKVDTFGRMREFLKWMENKNGMKIKIHTAQTWAQGICEPREPLRSLLLEKIK